MITVNTPTGPRYFKDGTTPDMIKAALSAPPPPLTATDKVQAFRDIFRQKATPMLPNILGAAGGLVGAAVGGPLLSPLGASIGGSIGEAGRQFDTGEPLDAGSVVRQGGVQGALDIAGQGLAAGAMRTGGWLYGRAASVAPRIAERFGMTPEELSRAMFLDRLGINRPGMDVAKQAGRGLVGQRNALIASAPGTVQADALASKAIAGTEARIGRPLTATERQAIARKVQAEADRILTERSYGAVPHGNPGTPAQPASSILDEYGRPAIPARPAVPGKPSQYTASQVEQIKEVADRNANPARRAVQNMANASADPELSAELAGGARARLDRIAGVSELNPQISQNMAKRMALRKAFYGNNKGWLPIHIPLTPISLGLKVPRSTMADIALKVSSPGFQTFARHSPRAAAALVTLALQEAGAGQ